MTQSVTPAQTDAWTLIDAERRRDRIIRRVSVVAWAATVLVVLLFGGLTAWQVSQAMKLVAAGGAPSTTVLSTALPFVAVLGVLSLLIATLTTVGVFMRFRTASLAEIQVRLGALEQMLAGRPDS